MKSVDLRRIIKKNRKKKKVIFKLLSFAHEVKMVRKVHFFGTYDVQIFQQVFLHLDVHCSRLNVGECLGKLSHSRDHTWNEVAPSNWPAQHDHTEKRCFILSISEPWKYLILNEHEDQVRDIFCVTKREKCFKTEPSRAKPSRDEPR